MSLQASRLASLLALLALLTACSPQYNWREAHVDSLPFRILMPAKPSSFTRQIDLNGTPLQMTMTAAEVDDLTFAVGTAELADASQAASALASMRTALLNNIQGVLQEGAIPGPKTSGDNRIDMAAAGVVRGQPVYLMARLQSSNRRIYQILILGPKKAITADHAEMFFASFSPG